MGATSDFRIPAWTNPIDTDLDQMRDNFNFLLVQAVAGSHVAPGWATSIDVSTNNDYSQPDAVLLSRGSRQIKVNIVWL